MSKISQFTADKNWLRLNNENKEFISIQAEKLKLTFQDIKQLIDISIDFQSWDEGNIQKIWPNIYPEKLKDKELKTYTLNLVKQSWLKLKQEPTDYSNFSSKSDFNKNEIVLTNIKEDRTLLGKCPVASEKTRCCNLQTLDSVINCGFDCSYCTIQSFYKGGKVLFESNLKEKLNKIDIDPNKKYHIGTGQSSDSLMWGNYKDNLTHLFEFAEKNPNVILELKTKSDNIEYILENNTPKNIICTWSINTQTIIDNEEHLTASLQNRLNAAKLVSQKGNLVGFHFHPMVYYNNWKDEYSKIAEYLIQNFNPSDVALVSIGTLTFIKPVIKQIRNRNFKTKILQMPLLDAEGKYSYSYKIKKEMFSFLYNSFKQWHNKVFFYMCMEDKNLWKDVFNKEYTSNDQFEMDMVNSYFTKIEY